MTALPATPPIVRAARPIGAAPLTILQRVWCLVLAIGCATMLGLGVWMNPDPSGHGTHTQIGLPVCGWKMALDYPCATCGMTTAVAHAAHGQFWSSIKAQPFGFLVALAAGVAFWICLHGAITGSRVDRILWRVLRPRALTVGGILFAAAWGYKIWADASGVT